MVELLEIMTFQIACLLLVLGYVLRSYLKIVGLRVSGSLPPGPFPWPFLGNSLDVDSDRLFESVDRLKEKYGKALSLVLGNQLTVYIADLGLLRKLFRDERLAGRPDTIWNYFGFSGGISLIDGPVQKVHRRFAIQALRDYGFGRGSDEIFIQKEAADLLQTFRNTEGKPFDNQVMFAASVSNVVSYMLLGDRFDTTDPRLVQYIQQEIENFKYTAGGSLIETYLWLRYIPPFRGEFQRMRRGMQAQRDLLKQVINEHRRSFDPTNPRDYIDAYLVQQQAGSPTFTGTVNDDQLLSTVADLYGAAMETTTTFLRWATLYMILYPEVQRKVRDEINRNVGHSRALAYSDRQSLPYLEATINEIYRMSNFLPFLLPHKTTSELELDGYVLPKDTVVVGLAWSIHMDPDLWTDPDLFQPERFLNCDTASNIIIFSVGKRACPGEQLARMEAFLFLGSILQHFIVEGGDGLPPSAVPVNGLTLTPPAYKMKITSVI